MGKVRFPEAPTSFPLPTKSAILRVSSTRHAPASGSLAPSPSYLAGQQDSGSWRRASQRAAEEEIAKNKAKRKEAREDALKSADVGTLRAELSRLEQHKRMGLASNEKLQRMTQLEKAIEWHEEQRKANAARGAAPAAPVVKVKNLGALRVRGSGSEIVAAGARVDSGLGERRPQDSVYYHPTLNPTGRPPPGKPQKYKANAGAYDDDGVAGEEGDNEDDGWGVPGEPCVVPAADAEDAGILPPPPGPPPSDAPPPRTSSGAASGAAPRPAPGPPPGPRLAPRLGRLRGLLPALLRSFRRPGLLPGLPGGRTSRTTASRTASRRAHRRGGR